MKTRLQKKATRTTKHPVSSTFQRVKPGHWYEVRSLLQDYRKKDILHTAYPVQAKLNVSTPGDIYEKEADTVADHVVSMDQCHLNSKSHVASTCPQRHSVGLGAESGKPLADNERSYFEPRLGCDFAHVRIHTGKRANALCRSINAQAFTHGNHIYLNDRRRHSSSEKHLMAHELTHVVQQTGQTQQVETSQAPLTMLLRFAGEDSEMIARRVATVQLTRHIAEDILNAISSGYLWGFERVIENGRIGQVYGRPGSAPTVVEDSSVRRQRLMQLVIELRGMASQLESGPIPTGWLSEDVAGDPGQVFDVAHHDATVTDVARFFLNYERNARGVDWAESQFFYIETRPTRRRVVAPVRFPAATATGINILIPDPENEPWQYRSLAQESDILEEGSTGVIIEVFEDSLGFFYTFQSVRHDLPGPP